MGSNNGDSGGSSGGHGNIIWFAAGALFAAGAAAALFLRPRLAALTLSAKVGLLYKSNSVDLYSLKAPGFADSTLEPIK